MPTHQQILPVKAIELVDAAGLRDACVLLADFAAAGLIKTYALVRTTKSMGSPIESVRDAQIPAEVWKRIVIQANVGDALGGRTVRLEGSNLQGGTPSIEITGVSFSKTSLEKVLRRYCETQLQACAPILPPSIKRDSVQGVAATASSPHNGNPPRKQTSRILPGDLTASIAQTMQTTGLGRTKITELMKNGTLERQKVGSRVLITVKSIERLVGAKIAQ